MAVLKSLNWDERCQLKIAKKRPYFSRNVTQRFFYFEIMFMAVYGCFKISQTVKGVAKITVRLAFSRFVVFFFPEFSSNVQNNLWLFKNLPGCDRRYQGYNTRFLHPVCQPNCLHFQITFTEVFGILKISHAVIDVAKIAIGYLSPNSFAILRSQSWCSLVFRKSPRL